MRPAGGTATTLGTSSAGILAGAQGSATVNALGAIATSGSGSDGIAVYATGGPATVTAAGITTSGDGGAGIRAQGQAGVAVSNTGGITTSGVGSDGIAVVVTGGNGSVISGNISTTGRASNGIIARGGPGALTVTSANVTTSGQVSAGIFAKATTGAVTVTSVNVTTSSINSLGIYAGAGTGAVAVTSTGTVTTRGDASPGIIATSQGNVTISAAAVVTTGNNSPGILAFRTAPPSSSSLTALALGPAGGVSITSGSVATGGANSPGVYAYAQTGDVQVVNTGTVTTTGAGSSGVVALSQAGAASVDVNAVSVAGGNSAGIVISSATSGLVTIRGLVQATTGYEIQASGGATTVNNTATGIIRGQVLLTNSADVVNNAGLFDALGTSQFGGGTDTFNNSGLVQSFSGNAVFAGLETFNNTGRVEMRNNALGDTLNVTGAFIGGAGSHLGVDASISAALADVLITGAATGSTILDVNLLGAPVFNLAGTLVVDGSAGTSATAFTLASTATSNPYVTLNLFFDQASNNFYLVGNPTQPVFESTIGGEAMINLWYDSADAVTAQLEAARDGIVLPGTTSSLVGGGRFGGWVQFRAGHINRDASQSFAGAGGVTVFDTSYNQDLWGVQGGLDYQSGGTILGLTFGYERSDVDFDASLSAIRLDDYNVGAYAAFQSGGFFFNAIGKVDWVNADSRPAAIAPTRFNAMSWGLRGNSGYRFNFGNAFVEPVVSLTYLNVNIDDYVTAGATVAFDDIHSFRGSVGIRFGGDFPVGNGATLSPALGIHAVDEFEGKIRNVFTLGQSIALEQDAPGTFGELTGGITLRSGSFEAFARGEYDFAGHRDGFTGRAGLRFRF